MGKRGGQHAEMDYLQRLDKDILELYRDLYDRDTQQTTYVTTKDMRGAYDMTGTERTLPNYSLEHYFAIKRKLIEHYVTIDATLQPAAPIPSSCHAPEPHHRSPRNGALRPSGDRLH